VELEKDQLEPLRKLFQQHKVLEIREEEIR
jgi:hypothetical protein